MDLDKSKQITDISFEDEGSHLAVIHSTQGGSANNWHDALIMKATADIQEDTLKDLIKSDVPSFELLGSLMKFFGDDPAFLMQLMGIGEPVKTISDANPIEERMKTLMLLSTLMKSTELVDIAKASDEVIVSLSMQEFLQKFFNMYYEDSYTLAAVLGYDSDTDNDEWLEAQIAETKDKVLVMKAATQGFDNLDEEESKTVNAFGIQLIEKMSKGIRPEDDNINDGLIPKGETMTDNVEMKDLQKSLQDLQKSFKAEQAKREEAEDLLKAVVAKEEAEQEAALIAKAKGFEFVGEEAETLGKILKSLDTEACDVVLAVLEKAAVKAEAKEADMFEQKAEETEAEDVVKATSNESTKAAVAKLLAKNSK